VAENTITINLSEEVSSILNPFLVPLKKEKTNGDVIFSKDAGKWKRVVRFEFSWFNISK